MITLPNCVVEQTASSHSLAAAALRERSAPKAPWSPQENLPDKEYNLPDTEPPCQSVFL
jgi:hypothetical protein